MIAIIAMKKDIIILLCIVFLPWFGSKIQAQSEFTNMGKVLEVSKVDTVVVIDNAQDFKKARSLALQKAIVAALETLDTEQTRTSIVTGNSDVISDDVEDEVLTSEINGSEEIILKIHLRTDLQYQVDDGEQFLSLSVCKVSGTKKKTIIIMDKTSRD